MSSGERGELYSLVIEFENEIITDDQILSVAKAYSKVFSDESINKKDILSRLNEWRGMSESERQEKLGADSVRSIYLDGFYLEDIYDFKGYPKQQIFINFEDIGPAEIQKEGESTEDQIRNLKKYFDFIGELPSDAKVSMGHVDDFVYGKHDLEIVRSVNVFTPREIEKYGKENLKKFDKAFEIIELKNGNILIWLRKESPDFVFTDIRDEKKALEEYLKKLGGNSK